MPLKPEAYKDTSVPAEKSMAEIRKMLAKFGCAGVTTSEDLEGGRIVVRFAHLIPESDKRYAIVRLGGEIPVPAPVSSGRYRGGHYINPDRLQAEARERAERQAWRALYWLIKSRMESIVFGWETFEEAFLAHVEIVSMEGEKMTLGEWVLPRMASGRLALKAKED